MPDNNGNGLAARLAELEAKVAEGSEGGWMSDVQRALALLLIGGVVFMVAVFTLRIVWSGDPAMIAPLLKELKDALINMSLIALGFFFGSSLSKRNADAGQQKMVERLMTTPPTNGATTDVVAAAAATVAAKAAAPSAAAEAAPPAAAEAAPPAVDAELDRRGVTDPDKPKE